MKTISLLTFAFSLLVLVGCKQDKKDSDEKMDAVGVTDTIVTITPFEGSTAYPEASLSLNQPENGDLIEVPAGSVDFNFEVQNYELGTQTPGAGENGLAYSEKGQHIHFILDNNPYSAHYENNFTKEIEEGDHVMIAFLSRSYHEAVKNPNAFVVRKIRAGNPTDYEKMDVDLSAEHLFYSRPKGTYTGKDTEKILLDFFLVGTEISDEGNKIRVRINDGEEFLIEKWAPHVIENLPLGENKIELVLVDSELKPIPGPFNAVTRVITLEEGKEEM